MWDNVIVANIGWDAAYAGDDIVSHHKYVQEHGTGAEAYNFSAFDGLFYGYVRDGSALSRFSDHTWTIVFISKPDERSKLRLVGWYEEAVVGSYRDRPEYATDIEFPWLDDNQKFHFSALTKSAYILPEELREGFELPHGHRIKSGGIYYAAGGERDDRPEQASARKKMVEWLRKVIPQVRELSRIDREQDAGVPQIPGIQIDDGGHPFGYSPVPESEEHRSLREWVCANPLFVTGDASVSPGRPEFVLDSADRIDAAFSESDRFWAVEVKSRLSPPSDHYRGIFQCVKYRAVAAAMPKIGVTNVEAILVTERHLDPDHEALAQKLGIRHLIAPMDRA